MSEIRSQATPARDSGLTDALRDAVGDNYDHGRNPNLTGQLWHEDGIRDSIDWAGAARDLEREGWSKPRTVNSIEEALTLPQGTVIRPGPIVWPRSGEISVNISDQRHYVHWTGSDCPDELATWMLPFTVLFTPGEAG